MAAGMRIINLERDEKILSYWPRNEKGEKLGKPKIVRLASTLDDGKHEKLSASVEVSSDEWKEMNSDKRFMEVLRGLARPQSGDIERGPSIRVEAAAAKAAGEGF